MKKILLAIFVSIIIFGIYFRFYDNRILYVNIGDDVVSYSNNYEQEIITYLKEKNRFEKYIEYGRENYRITDFINDIKENKVYQQNKTLKNLLIKADFISIWIGNNDINYKMVSSNYILIYEYIDGVLEDADELLKLVRKNSKEQILVFGIYNRYGLEKKEYFDYYNRRLKELCEKYRIDFIDSDNILSTAHLQNNYLNKKGSELIGKEILKKLSIK